MNLPLIASAANDSEARLREVGYFFISTSFDWDKVAPLAFGIGAIFLFLCLLMLVNRIRNRYRAQDAFHTITNPGDIKDRIESAIHQRSSFEISFEPDEEGRRPILRCLPARLEQLSLILEIVGMPTLSPHWTGRKAECYFQVEYGHALNYHAFTTSIRAINTTRVRCFITIPLPQKLEYRQRRSYLRIIPPEEMLLGAALWHREQLPDESQMERINSWPRPALAFLPMVSTDLMIRDISAGGVRVHLSRQTAEKFSDYLQTTDKIILMLDLWDPEKGKRMRTWAKCRVQNPLEDFTSGGMDFGLQFLAWARAKEGSSGALIEWLRLSGSGEIEDLGNWIIRRHLEMFREIDKEMG